MSSDMQHSVDSEHMAPVTFPFNDGGRDNFPSPSSMWRTSDAQGSPASLSDSIDWMANVNPAPMRYNPVQDKLGSTPGGEARSEILGTEPRDALRTPLRVNQHGRVGAHRTPVGGAGTGIAFKGDRRGTPGRARRGGAPMQSPWSTPRLPRSGSGARQHTTPTATPADRRKPPQQMTMADMYDQWVCETPSKAAAAAAQRGSHQGSTAAGAAGPGQPTGSAPGAPSPFAAALSPVAHVLMSPEATSSDAQHPVAASSSLATATGEAPAADTEMVPSTTAVAAASAEAAATHHETAVEEDDHTTTTTTTAAAAIPYVHTQDPFHVPSPLRPQEPGRAGDNMPHVARWATVTGHDDDMAIVGDMKRAPATPKRTANKVHSTALGLVCVGLVFGWSSGSLTWFG